MTILERGFWGTQGRVGRATMGGYTNKLILAYPDTLPEWWYIIVESEVLDEHIFEGNSVLTDLVASWGVQWLEPGQAERDAEKLLFGIRPLIDAEAEWLPLGASGATPI